MPFLFLWHYLVSRANSFTRRWFERIQPMSNSVEGALRKWVYHGERGWIYCLQVVILRVFVDEWEIWRWVQWHVQNFIATNSRAEKQSCHCSRAQNSRSDDFRGLYSVLSHSQGFSRPFALSDRPHGTNHENAWFEKNGKSLSSVTWNKYFQRSSWFWLNWWVFQVPSTLWVCRRRFELLHEGQRCSRTPWREEEFSDLNAYIEIT